MLLQSTAFLAFFSKAMCSSMKVWIPISKNQLIVKRLCRPVRRKGSKTPVFTFETRLRIPDPINLERCPLGPRPGEVAIWLQQGSPG